MPADIPLPTLHPFGCIRVASQERAARFKTVGATATAFVTEGEQRGDSEAGLLVREVHSEVKFQNSLNK